jgi:DNA-binding NtrC family response regulator
MSLKKKWSKPQKLSTKHCIRFLLFAVNVANAGSPNHSTIDKRKKENHKILVIDDDDRFRKSLCYLLKKKFGAQVDDVNSGKLGLEKLNAGHVYTMIFTDIMMPEMTGIETYYEIRKINSHIRIIVMSAYSNSDEWKKAQTLTDIDLLHKPLPEDRLIEILR